jgi:branched-chain amino acid transport system substrate-binding protein
MFAKRWAVAVLTIAALSGGTSACARRGLRGAGPSDTLYVGVASARSNAAFFRGTQMALDRLNAQRPAGAHPLGMRLPPDTQPSQVQVAARFRDDPWVVGVVGHTGSAQTMDAAPVYGDIANEGRNAVVAITPTATNPLVTRVGDWVLRVCPTDDDAARALARYAVDSLAATRVAVVYRNDLFGRGFTRTISSELSGLKVTVMERDPYLAGITEYDAYAQRIAGSRPDAVIFAGGGVDAADMLRALRRAGVDLPILGTDDVANIVNSALLTPPAAPSPAASGKIQRGTAGARAPLKAVLYDPLAEFSRVRFTAFYDAAEADTPDERAFVTEFRKRFGQTPNHQAALAFDAATLIGRAVFATGGDRRKVRDWIASVGRDSPSFRGVTGEIRFDDRGDAVGKPVLIGHVGSGGTAGAGAGAGAK